MFGVRSSCTFKHQVCPLARSGGSTFGHTPRNRRLVKIIEPEEHATLDDIGDRRGA